MRRLQTVDKLLLALTVPLWAATFALSLRSALQPVHFSMVMARGPAHPDAAPRVATFRPYFQGDTELRQGDALLRLGERDLRGVNPVKLQILVLGTTRREPFRVTFERAGERREAQLPTAPLAMHVWAALPVSLAFAGVAILVSLRAPPSAMTRAGFLGLMSVGLATSCHFGGTPATATASIVLLIATFTLAPPLTLRALQRFPVDMSPGTLWGELYPWLFAPVGLITGLIVWGGLVGPLGDDARAIPAALGIPWFLVYLVVATRNYRRADAIGRRQMKWVLFGIYLAVLPLLAMNLASFTEPHFTLYAWYSQVGAVLVPLAILVAVARTNLLDIDRLISATAAYNVVLVVLAACGLLLVPRVASAASASLGIDAVTGQVVLSLALAAGVVPAQRRLRPRLEAIFFSERHAIDAGMAELLRELGDAPEAGTLLRLLGDRLHAILRPEASAVFARDGATFTPLLAAGRALPPAFPEDGALVGALRERREPLVAERFAQERPQGALTAFDRAALETLEAAVVLPVRRDRELSAFVCLGPKRSGDFYTPTDVRLLRGVTEKASSELSRFAKEDLLAESRALQDSLRRYVPGAVADELASGGDLAAGEREVSVLFVDIRGYSRFSEDRGAAEVFSAVNRYTETVSRIVREHGGAVVEFNGDGMMAVFGAPRPLTHKERAAVAAGREIVAAVGEIAVADAPRLAVGVGIATGPAFVGNIQAADRMIWSAIGNTTNLAARLQAATRELDAVIVIDAATREAVADHGGDFELRAAMRLRGRSAAQDVHVLPLGAGSGRQASGNGMEAGGGSAASGSARSTRGRTASA